MATVYSDFGTLQNSARTNLALSPNFRQYGGPELNVDVKLTAYTGATTDPVYLWRFNKGDRLLPHRCSVDYGAPASTAFTGKIGYLYDDAALTSDDDAYGAALAFGTAASRKLFSEAGTKGDAFLNPVVFQGDGWLVFTPTTVTAALAHAETWHLGFTRG